MTTRLFIAVFTFFLAVGSTAVGGSFQMIKYPLKVKGSYPMGASLLKGTVVVLEITIGKDGKVMDAKVIKSAGEDVDKLTLAAAKTWEYTPTKINGMAIEVVIEVAFNFRSVD